MQDLGQHLKVLKRNGYAEDEAVILLMRLQLIKIIKSEVLRREWSQREAAEILGVSQPRIAEIFALATDKFSVEKLVKYLLRLDLETTLCVKPGREYEKPGRRRKKTLPTKRKESPCEQ